MEEIASFPAVIAAIAKFTKGKPEYDAAYVGYGTSGVLGAHARGGAAPGGEEAPSPGEGAAKASGESGGGPAAPVVARAASETEYGRAAVCDDMTDI